MSTELSKVVLTSKNGQVGILERTGTRRFRFLNFLRSYGTYGSLLGWTLGLATYSILKDSHLAILITGYIQLSALFSLGFQKPKWDMVCRFGAIISWSIFISLISIYLGSQSISYIGLLLSAALPFAFFSSKEKIFILASVLISAFFLIALMTLNLASPIAIHPMTLHSLRYIDLFIVIFTFLGIAKFAFSTLINYEGSNRDFNQSEHSTRILLNSLCHDIANPLSVLSALSARINDRKPLTEPQLERIALASNQIVTVHGKLRQLGLLTGGTIRFELQPARVNEIIEECLATVSELIAAKKIELIMDLAPEQPFVNVDKSILAFQVICNLLTNAIKFSFTESKLLISSKIVGSQVVVEIRDFGQGIEQNRLTDIFSWQKMRSTPGTSGEVGTGFGLPIAKKFLSLMNGNVEITSRTADSGEFKKGTSVKIFLQLALPVELSIEEPRTASKTPQSH